MTATVLASTQLWWFMARSTGIVAWATATFSVLLGLALATRALGKRVGSPWLNVMHSHAAWLTVGFLAAHLAALVLDSYIEFDAADLLIPGASPWKTNPVALGIVAMYLIAAVFVTSLVRSHIPKGLWRNVHVTSYAAWLLATAHMLTAGSDAKNPVIFWAALGSVALGVFLLVYRCIGPGRAASVRSKRP